MTSDIYLPVPYGRKGFALSSIRLLEMYFFHITETRNYEFRSVFYSYVIHGLLPEKSMVDEG